MRPVRPRSPPRNRRQVRLEGEGEGGEDEESLGRRRRRRPGIDQGPDAGVRPPLSHRGESRHAPLSSPGRQPVRNHLDIGLRPRPSQPHHRLQRRGQPRHPRTADPDPALVQDGIRTLGRVHGRDVRHRVVGGNAPEGPAAESRSDAVPEGRAHPDPRHGRPDPVPRSDRGPGAHTGRGRGRNERRRAMGQRRRGGSGTGGGDRRGRRSPARLESPRRISGHGLHSKPGGQHRGGTGSLRGAGDGDEGAGTERQDHRPGVGRGVRVPDESKRHRHLRQVRGPIGGVPGRRGRELRALAAVRAAHGRHHHDLHLRGRGRDGRGGRVPGRVHPHPGEPQPGQSAQQ
mmetsp:Transcript_28887/g.59132  ORF Transcript_28887/g.59132 Transcript_28887/m.59132 type:complete len:344 (-) Transcript_28887:1237-2268(-)